MDLSGDQWWAEARAREQISRIKRWALDEDDSPAGWERHRAAMRWLASEKWVPDRPGPRLPSKWSIASYWDERGEPFDVFIERPHCFACGLDGNHQDGAQNPRARWNAARNLQRGHIVNRARHGLDALQNLVPLCAYCNRLMPVFDIHHADEAVDWIFAGGAIGEIERRLAAVGGPA